MCTLMENNPHQLNKSPLQERLLAKIESNELKMRSKVYFMVKLAILMGLAGAILIISILISNLILFGLRLNGHESLLMFGSRGFLLFLVIFPWSLLLIDLFLIAVLEILIRRFRFGYQTPLLYLLLLLVVVTISCGIFIDRVTSVNDRLLERAEKNKLPQPFGKFYEEARWPVLGNGMCRCVITAISGDTLVVYNPDIGTTTSLTIILPVNGGIATSTLEVGDIIFIAGDSQRNTIKAFGVQKLSPHSIR